MRRRLIAVLAGVALVVMGIACGDGTESCTVGSTKYADGHVYHCKDDGNGPRWVKE